MSKLKYLIPAMIVLVAILVLLYFNGQQSANDEIDKSIQGAMTYLCSRDTEINDLVAGDVLFRLSNLDDNVDVKLNEVKVKVERVNEKYAEAICRMDVELRDGTADVGWYKIRLINKEGWRVYDIENTNPIALDGGEFKGGMEELIYIFKNFIDNTRNNKVDAIKNYSAGTVRRNLELYGQQEELIDNIDNLNFNYLCGDAKTTMIDANYKVNGNNVSNLITFYNTKDGWKIVDIKSSLIK